MSTATVERHHQVMRAIFRKAVKDRLIAHVPTDVDRPKGPPRRLRIPDDVAVVRAMDELDGDFGNFFRLLVLTGIAFLTGTISNASFWLLETFPILGKIG